MIERVVRRLPVSSGASRHMPLDGVAIEPAWSLLLKPSPLLAALLVAAVSVPAFAQDTDTAEASATVSESVDTADEANEPVPWTGSTISLRTATSAISTSEAAELSFNPYTEMSLTLAPRWRFTDIWSASAQMSFSRELTNSDWTTRQNETLVGDLSLRGAASNFVTIPGAEIGVSADLALQLPTSKVSRARTLVMGIGPGISLSRSVDVLAGMRFGYSIRGTYFWHRYTTGEYRRPYIDGCTVDCDAYLSTGVRNPVWRLSNAFSFGLAFIDELSMGLSYAIITDPLHDAVTTEFVTLTPQTPTDTRFTNSFDVNVSYAPIDLMSFTLGANTTNAQLAVDGERRTPLFNRYTILYFDVAFDLGAPFNRGG